MSLKKTINFITENEKALLLTLIEFLKIQSISTDQNFFGDCRLAATWLTDHLREWGFIAKTHETEGHPIVLASAGEGSQHILFYGHYDVQPIDPLKAWNTYPFEPKIKIGSNGKVVCARGASDDKGQLMTFINACKAFIKIEGKLPCKVSIVIEGEEEIGSPSLEKFLKSNKEDLKADYALICDTGMWDAKTPAISTMLRGAVSEEITLTAANKDLHSGLYGGPIINPIKELSRVITTLHHKDGRVAINNFYKDVHELPKKLKNQWNELNFSPQKFLNNLGLSVSAGDQSYSLLEQIWGRPTCEITGIWGGYTGTGFKTVIPSEASAKVSFRLVGDQEPENIRLEFRNHIKNNLHKDCNVDFVAKDGSKAVSIPLDSPVIKAAERALLDEWEVSPVLIGCGGSIPVVGSFKEILDLDTLLVGFSLEDDQIHAPNEKYNLQSYQKGAKSWIRIINEIAN